MASSGAPLPTLVQATLEKSFNAELGSVRVHTGQHAVDSSRGMSARAFAFGQHIFLGAGEHPTDLRLMAHETAHVLQQTDGATVQTFKEGSDDILEREAASAADAVQQGRSFRVRGRTGLVRVQRLGISDALDYFADQANLIPGFRLLTIVLGVNPINMSRVERNAANILRALIELLPLGGLITQALDNSGVFEKVGTWVEQQIQTLGLVGSVIKQAVTDFLGSLGLTDFLNPGGIWNRAKRIFTDPVDRIINFGRGLVTGIVKSIKDAILRPIAKLAEGTAGYELLKGVLGKDPITDEPVPRTAETLIGPFMKLIGEEEIWENMKKANAIPRAWAWFQGALSGLRDFVAQIPALFVAAFNALELSDIVLVPRAFAKLAAVFGGFLTRFTSWAGSTIWNLLEIIFDVVSPGALSYIKKTGAALKNILKNPLPFVGNLVKAAKLGFENFAANFGGHLKAGLIDWLTGALPGVYIPKAFELGEIVKFVFSVLGLSWQNVRQKLVKVVGEPAVKAMETGFDIVVTLVTQGPAAAWDKIKGQLANLKDMVISGITDFVVDMVVKKAVPKLIAMFIPGAGFISAIISIYDTVMVFVHKISKIIQVVTGFIDSMVAISRGETTPAANKVETALASAMSLAINLFAGFAGLGDIADKVMGVIKKVRDFIDKALDSLINWIVTMAKKLFAKVFGKEEDGKEDTEKSRAVKEEAKKTLQAHRGNFASFEELASLFDNVYSQYQPQGLKFIGLIREGDGQYSVGVGASAVDRIARVKALLQFENPKEVFALVQINEFYMDVRQYKNPGRGVHAEDVLVPDFPQILARYAEKYKDKPAEKVEITIKYSPCKEKCTPNIIALKGAYPSIKSWTVYYVELYGQVGSAEFDRSVEAMRELQDADIGVTRYDDVTSSEKARRGKL